MHTRWLNVGWLVVACVIAIIGITIMFSSNTVDGIMTILFGFALVLTGYMRWRLLHER